MVVHSGRFGLLYVLYVLVYVNVICINGQWKQSGFRAAQQQSKHTWRLDCCKWHSDHGFPAWFKNGFPLRLLTSAEPGIWFVTR